MQEGTRLDAFVEMVRRLREPHLIASRTGRILGANVAAADALSTTLTGLESESLEDYSIDPAGLRAWLGSPLAEASLQLRARNGGRFSCDASVLAHDLVLVRLSGGPDGASRARSFVETLALLRGTAAGVAASETHAELARALLTPAMSSLGARVGGVYLLDETGTNLELVGTVASTDEENDRFRLIPVTAPVPLAEAVRRATGVFIGTPEEFAAGYPELTRAHPGIAGKRAYAALPLERGGRVVGAVAMAFASPWTFGERDRAALQALARQCAEVFDWAQRAEGALVALERDARGHSSLERLHAFTRSLAQAITPSHVAEAVVDVGMAATSARSGGLWLVSDDGLAVSLVRSVGPGGPRPEDFVRLPLDSPRQLLVLDVIRGEAPVWLESSRQMEERYPHVLRAFGTGGESALACVPLVAQGRCIGGLVLHFDAARHFAEEDRAFLQVLSWHAAHAIERSRLYAAERRAREAAEASQRRSELLAHAGALLASSLDVESALSAVARAAVPRIADWCIVDLEELLARGLPPVAAHVDPSKQPLAQEVGLRVRALFGRDPTMPVVIRTGKAELHRRRTIDQVRDWGRGDAALCDLVERAGVASSMVVPISARGRTLGIIALYSADPARLYDEQDLAMAEELGRRAGLAVDNARLYEDAREADRQKDEFLAMLSHELRNPLAPIVTALELMRRDGDRAGSRERAIIARHVQHVVRLVDDLLDVARVKRGKIELRPEPRELAPIVATAVEMTSPLVKERGQRLSVSAAQRGLVVKADAVRLAQAISNLIVNASRYTEAGGAITLLALAERGDAVVRVRDSGIGIAPEMLPRIFDLFVQEKRALDRAQGGLGIGLTVVKGLVELHGGTVSAHSDGPGKGSEFVIRLPLAAGETAVEPPPTSREAAVREPAPGAQPLRVLVVDDNVDAADMLNQALHVLGCAVRVAYDGEEALAAAPAFAPDLALVDIGLPVMNGYELVGHLRRLAAGPRRIVAITGYGQATDVARSRDAGFDEHIVKPVDLGTLEKVIDRSRTV